MSTDDCRVPSLVAAVPAALSTVSGASDALHNRLQYNCCPTHEVGDGLIMVTMELVTERLARVS